MTSGVTAAHHCQASVPAHGNDLEVQSSCKQANKAETAASLSHHPFASIKSILNSEHGRRMQYVRCLSPRPGAYKPNVSVDELFV
jgi:hypothetical protein